MFYFIFSRKNLLITWFFFNLHAEIVIHNLHVKGNLYMGATNTGPVYNSQPDLTLLASPSLFSKVCAYVPVKYVLIGIFLLYTGTCYKIGKTMYITGKYVIKTAREKISKQWEEFKIISNQKEIEET
jgi:hypothetical protein